MINHKIIALLYCFFNFLNFVLIIVIYEFIKNNLINTNIKLFLLVWLWIIISFELIFNLYSYLTIENISCNIKRNILIIILIKFCCMLNMIFIIYSIIGLIVKLYERSVLHICIPLIIRIIFNILLSILYFYSYIKKVNDYKPII